MELERAHEKIVLGCQGFSLPVYMIEWVKRGILNANKRQPLYDSFYEEAAPFEVTFLVNFQILPRVGKIFVPFLGHYFGSSIRLIPKKKRAFLYSTFFGDSFSL